MAVYHFYDFWERENSLEKKVRCGKGRNVSVRGTWCRVIEPPNVNNSELCTAEAVVDSGTVMVAVMSTLAAATVMVTNHTSTTAAAATLCFKLEVSE